MTSLVPFDFRCLHHLIGVSLRCAPLHVRLTASRPLPTAPTARDGAALPVVPTSAPYDGGHDSSRCLPVSSVKSGEEGSFQNSSMQLGRETATAAALRCSSSPPPHTASGDDCGCSSLPLPPSPGQNTTPLAEEAAHATGDITPSARTVEFHSPSLCIEIYYTIDVLPPFSSSAARASQALSAASVQLKHDTEGSRMHGDRGDGVDASAVQERWPPTLATSPALVYTSELARGSSHPCWSAIPPEQLNVYGAATQVELAFYYTAACLSDAVSLVASASDTTPSAAAPLDDIVPTDVCVYRCQVDMRDVVYAGSTVKEADATLSRVFHIEQQQQPQTRCCTKPIIFLRYTDGVFVPRVCLSDVSVAATAMLEEMRAARTRTFAPPPTVADLQVISPSPATLHTIGDQRSITAAAAVAACEELPWSRAPSSVGWRYPPTAVPRAGPLRVTMGDLKAATLTTVAWQRLADVTEARQASLAADLNREAAADPQDRAQEALCAALRVQLSAARERLALSTLELEGLREQVERRKRQLRRQEEAHAELQSYQAYTASPEALEQSRVMAREEEAKRARLRAQLARTRQQRTRELCLVYTVELSSQYANEACTRAADAKDHINKCALPIIFAGRADADTASHLVASTAGDMHEEAVALGHAGHLLIVLSILYSCALPYPILLGGGQSHVLPSPNISAEQVLAAPYTLTDALKYPLSCHKVAERPLMMAGVHFLLRDGIALAKAMGKPERRALACSDRLGALLDLLLHDAE